MGFTKAVGGHTSQVILIHGCSVYWNIEYTMIVIKPTDGHQQNIYIHKIPDKNIVLCIMVFEVRETLMHDDTIKFHNYPLQASYDMANSM